MTRPSYFGLHVRLNSQSDNPEEKSRAANSLVSLSLEYEGRFQDFPINMDDYSTRLIVLEGNFEVLSLAIYGRPTEATGMLLDAPHHVRLEYEPVDLPDLNFPSLPPSIDVARMTAPIQVARQLIAEDYPEWRFETIVQHLIAEKDQKAGRTSNGDASPEHVAQALSRCVSEVTTDVEDWLDNAVNLSRSPFLSSVPADVDKLVERLHEVLAPDAPSHDDFQRQCFFELMHSMTIQPDYVVLNFLTPGILAAFISETAMEEADLLHLHASMLNPNIARALREDTTAITHLRSISESSQSSPPMRRLAGDIISRVNGWVTVETLFSPNAEGDRSSPVPDGFIEWVTDFVAGPDSLEPLLLNMALLASPIQDNVRIPSPRKSVQNRKEALALLRAVQGITSISAVLCWAILDLNVALAYRILAILDLLQSFDYDEVIGLVLRHPFVNGYLQEIGRAESTPVVVINLINKMLARSPRGPDIASQDGSLAAHGEQQFVSGDLEVLSHFESRRTAPHLDLPMLYAVKSALASYSYLHRCHTTVVPDNAMGLFFPILHATFRVVDILARAWDVTDNDYEPLPHSSLLEAAALGLEALRVALPMSPLYHNAREQIVQTSVSAYVHSQNFPDALQERCRTLQYNAIALLSTLLSPSVSSLSEAAFLIGYIARCPTEQSLAGPNITIRLFDILKSLLIPTPSPGTSIHPWSRILAATLRELNALLSKMPPPTRSAALQTLDELDTERIGVRLGIVGLQCQYLQEACTVIVDGSEDSTRWYLLQKGIEDACAFLESVELDEDPEALEFDEVTSALAAAFETLLHANLHIPSISSLAASIAPDSLLACKELVTPCVTLFLRESHMSSALSICETYQRCSALLTPRSVEPDKIPQIIEEIGRSLSRIATEAAGMYQFEGEQGAAVAEAVLSILNWAANVASTGNAPVPFYGLSKGGFDAICDIFSVWLSTNDATNLVELRNRFVFVVDDEVVEPLPEYSVLPEGPLSVSYDELWAACHGNASDEAAISSDGRPSTPQHTSGVVAALMSPPILRSPTITGPTLHKKYSAQDFRSARLSPTSASRPPSTHVDAFDNATLSPRASPTSPLLAIPSAGLQSPLMIYHSI